MFDFTSGSIKSKTTEMTGKVEKDIYTENMNDRVPLVSDNIFPHYIVKENCKVVMHKSHEMNNAGQQFLPYFDSQNISLEIPAPLSGMQLIYYYTQTNSNIKYGGFIIPRTNTINYYDYLKMSNKI